MMKKVLSLLFFSVACLTTSAQSISQLTVNVVSSPSQSRYTHIDKKHGTVIPNGRIITPIGKCFQTAPHPYGLVLSQDGTIAVTANSGTSPISITILRGINTNHPSIQQVPEGASSDKGVLASAFMGLAISPDNQYIYVSGGEANCVYRFSVKTGAKIDSIDCALRNGMGKRQDGYLGDMVQSRDGNFLYVVDQTGFQLLTLDTQSQRVVDRVPTGRYPFGITLSPDQMQLFVANVGMFEYSKIGNIERQKDYKKALDFPAFAYGSKEMREGVERDSVRIKGLGDPNVPESFSVWTYSIKKGDQPNLKKQIKTGVLVGDLIEDIPAVGGASPNSVVATNRYLFVSNGTNDNLSVIDLKRDTVTATIPLKLHPAVSHFRGVIPFGLALSPDQKRLYVAESGVNAVAIIDVDQLKVIGHIPTAWFPSKLAVSPDGKHLLIANAKGYGSGPNGGKHFKEQKEGSYIGSLMKGSVQKVNLSKINQLEKYTQSVIENNYRIENADVAGQRRGQNPIPLYGGERSTPIKYIVFVSKENRTYDEIFGQLKGSVGDPSLARYGENRTFSNHKKSQTITGCTVMPNHLKLARTFGVADNFYVDSDVSADGHRWLVNTYPNEWVESTVPASYGGNRHYNANLTAPGALALTGSAGAIYPEDYNEAGSLWDHLERNNKDFFNFGFGTMFEPAFYEATFKFTGVKHYVNFPVPKPMFTKTSRTYPTYNTAIPDQFRIHQFISEFQERWMKPGSQLPSVLTVIVPNDHGAGERPDAGYPFRESYMSDNDLAIGRLVEFLSHTPYWKNMAIIITEDDAQNGVDHVDAHRSILMVISPYAKRNYVSKVHYSFGSIFKTMWNVLGVPYLNQYDAAANDFADFFTNQPDFTPYQAVPVDVRVFDPKKALTPLDEKFDWEALKEAPLLDDVKEMKFDQKEREEDRIQNRTNK